MTDDPALFARMVDECSPRIAPACRPLLVPAIAYVLDTTWDANGRCIQGRICPRRQSYGHVCSCSAKRLTKWAERVGLAPAVQAERDRILVERTPEHHAEETARENAR